MHRFAILLLVFRVAKVSEGTQEANESPHRQKTRNDMGLKDPYDWLWLVPRPLVLILQVRPAESRAFSLFSHRFPPRSAQLAMRPGVLLRAQETWTVAVLAVSGWLFFGLGGWQGVLGGLLGILLITLVIARGAWVDLPPPVDPKAEGLVKKHAVVTGGTQGIGGALAEVLKEQGYEVYAAGKTATGHHLDLGEAATIKARSYRLSLSSF
jgi:hypothetical protein